MVQSLKGLLPSNVEALMIYGSRARGDARPDSDLDVLAVVPSRTRSVSTDGVSLSFYTFEELATGVGSLFGYHLARDGIVLFDPAGSLRHALSRFASVDCVRLLARIQELTVIFDCTESEKDLYLHGLARQARYFLRSALYIEAIAEGRPCFSLRELGVRHEDPQLPRLLSSRNGKHMDRSDLEECISRLSVAVGPFPENPYPTLEGLAMARWGDGSDLATVIAMSVADESPVMPYSDLRKILL